MTTILDVLRTYCKGERRNAKVKHNSNRPKQNKHNQFI